MTPEARQTLLETLGQAFADWRPVTLRATLLQEGGEEKLELMVERIMHHLDRDDLAGTVYAGVRELVQNASKANLKRLLFDELNVDPADRQRYQQGMESFRARLVQQNIQSHVDLIREHGVYFDVVFHYSPAVLCVTVRNPFPLFAAEELRIREKFKQSAGADNLYEFYLRYGDQVEGAGMGIAMIQILLFQAGFPHRCLSIFSDPGRSQTVSRIILPLSPEYKSPRARFASEAAHRGIAPDQLREEMRQGLVRFPILQSRVEKSDWYPGK